MHYRKKLPINPMDRGVLTDGADYIFLDGRPTPFGMKQKRKLLLQREYAVSWIERLFYLLTAE